MKPSILKTISYVQYIIIAGCILAITFGCSDNPSSAPEPQIPDPVFGIIEVEVSTTGEDDDPDGYIISVQGGETIEIGPNGTVTFNQITTGNKTVTLTGIPGHCTIEGSPSQSFTLGDNEVRTIQFEISCSAIFRDKILFMMSTGVPFEYQIYSMDPDGNNVRQVSDMILPAFAMPSSSPEGLKVVFSGTDAQNGWEQIWVQHSDGTGLQNLTNNPDNRHLTPVWSPDGSKIAFSAIVGGQNNPADIFLMDSDGSNVVNVTDNPDFNDQNPSWSPDGNELAFSSFRPNPSGGNLFSISIISANGTGRKTIIEDEGFLVTAPKWSPDGSKIAFERFQQFTQNPRQIHLMNPDGSDVRNITADGGNPNLGTFSAAWSPDGSKIAFHAITIETQNIFIMNSDGEIQGSRITNGENRMHHINPSWSPFTRN
jgi:Tol biopolymer transport system component